MRIQLKSACFSLALGAAVTFAGAANAASPPDPIKHALDLAMYGKLAVSEAWLTPRPLA